MATVVLEIIRPFWRRYVPTSDHQRKAASVYYPIDLTKRWSERRPVRVHIFPMIKTISADANLAVGDGRSACFS
jgi:hypothetical protein